MKKLLHIALLSALAFSFTPMKAAVTSERDLYGTWTFKAKVEMIDNSFADKEAFSGDCEVIIGPTNNPNYNCEVTGFAGSSTSVPFFIPSTDKSEFGTLRSSGPTTWKWGETDLVYGTSESANPYWDPNCDLDFIIRNAEGTEITVDTFYLVTVADKMGETCTPIVRFTECTLSLKEKKEVPATDMSGNWHFTGGEGNMPSENFPAEFDMTLETANEMNTLYKATMTFDGYEPVIFENVTFNDKTMTFPISNTYVDQENGIVFADANGALEGTFSFTKNSEKNMSVNFSIRVKEGETQDWAVFSGNVTKKTDDIDFTGTYTITSNTIENYYVEGRKTTFEVPAVSEMTIIDQGYGPYITKIFGQDLGQLAIAATASGDTLTIPAVNGYYGFAAVYSNQGTYLVLSTESDKISDDIKFYWDEEEQTFKLDGMFLLYYEYGNNESIAMEAYINPCTAERKVEEWNYLGDYTMNATVTTTAAAADYADFDFAESSKFTLTEAQGPTGLATYVTTFMNADALTLNYGGFVVTVDEQEKTLSFNGALVYFNYAAGKQLSLRDAEQGTNPIVVTYNADGTITMSDFTIVDGAGNLVATCTNVTLTPSSGSDAIESVSSDRKAAVYAADGVIYIAGEPTRVEVYSISGAQEYSGITNEIGGLKRGFYLVKANGSTSKVIVR